VPADAGARCVRAADREPLPPPRGPGAARVEVPPRADDGHAPARGDLRRLTPPRATCHGRAGSGGTRPRPGTRAGSDAAIGGTPGSCVDSSLSWRVLGGASGVKTAWARMAGVQRVSEGRRPAGAPAARRRR
jgi:hypothetical protein